MTLDSPSPAARSLRRIAHDYLVNGAMEWEYLLVTATKR